VPQIKFKVKKKTAQSVRFEEEVEDGKAAAMGTVYLQKWVIRSEGVDPEQVTELTIPSFEVK
jgi:hypothetical protein